MSSKWHFLRIFGYLWVMLGWNFSLRHMLFCCCARFCLYKMLAKCGSAKDVKNQCILVSNFTKFCKKLREINTYHIFTKLKQDYLTIHYGIKHWYIVIFFSHIIRDKELCEITAKVNLLISRNFSWIFSWKEKINGIWLAQAMFKMWGMWKSFKSWSTCRGTQ